MGGKLQVASAQGSVRSVFALCLLSSSFPAGAKITAHQDGSSYWQGKNAPQFDNWGVCIAISDFKGKESRKVQKVKASFWKGGWSRSLSLLLTDDECPQEVPNTLVSSVLVWYTKWSLLLFINPFRNLWKWYFLRCKIYLGTFSLKHMYDLRGYTGL